ncbi:hypothetical protein [Aliagarivorans taiwanensis]|uniref:hypothetical protein n=1 Tax=Aliagarivorans taiwanensis TaxID=561966 RepID=UPI00041E40EF|nr:hypothetical protein [Aliagarivorans taiwanensis]
MFKGNFDWVITPTELGVRIEVNQVVDTSKGANYSLDALIKISGVDQAAKAYLEPALSELSGAAEQLKNLLDKYSSPSSWLTVQLSEHLAELADENPSLLLSVAQNLAIGSGDGIESSIKDYVEAKLLEVLDSKHLAWISADEAEAKGLASSLLASVGLSEAVIKTLKLDKHLAKQIVKANAKLNEEIEDLSGDAGAGANEELARVLQQIEGAKAKLDAAGEDITATLSELVSEWLTLYDQAASKFNATLKKLAAVEIGLSLYGAQSRKRKRGAMLSLELVQTNHAKVKRFYTDLLLGKPIDIEELRDGELSPYVANLSGWFEETYTSQSTLGLGLNLGDDFKFAQQRTLANIANAKVDSNGLLQAASSNVTLTDCSTTLQETRKTEFLGAFDVFAAIKLGAKPNIAVEIKFEDGKVMSSKELHQFLAPLNDNKLIDVVNLSAVENKFAEVLASGQAKRSRIECSVNLSKQEIDTTIATSPTRVCELTLQLLYRMCLREDEIKTIQENSNTADSIAVQLRTFADKGLSQYSPVGRMYSDLPLKVTRMLRHAEALSKVPACYQQMVSEVKTLSYSDPNRYIDIINGYNDEIIQALKYFVDARGALSGLVTEALPKSTQILLIVIATLIQRDEPILTTSISYDVGGETILL